MAKEQAQDPFERILKASNHAHLNNPFRTSDELRSKYFLGAGGKLSHGRLMQAYLKERNETSPDWQLLAHGTWPWLIGHIHDVANLVDDLKSAADSGRDTIAAKKRKSYVEQFSEAGTQEIETFLRIFVNAEDDFRKAVQEQLEAESRQTPSTPSPKPTAPATPAPSPLREPERPTTVDDLDPITRAKMAMIGTVFFFVLSLIPLGIQFWRQPDQDHWVIVGISGVLAVWSIMFFVDYTRKKP